MYTPVLLSFPLSLERDSPFSHVTITTNARHASYNLESKKDNKTPEKKKEIAMNKVAGILWKEKNSISLFNPFIFAYNSSLHPRTASPPTHQPPYPQLPTS
jgi:hypothetical protein